MDANQITTSNIARRRKQLALTLAVLALLVAGVVTGIRLAEQSDVPLLSESEISIASIITEITFAVGLLVTAISFQHCAVIAPASGEFWIFDTGTHWITRLSIAGAVGVVWAGLSAVVFAFAVVLLPGFIPVPALAMMVLAALYAGVLAYLAAYMAAQTNMMRTLRLAALVAVFGLGLAILFATNLDWWTAAISFLGVDANGRIFNVTLILLGLMLLSISEDAMRNLANLRQTGGFISPHFGWLRLAFIVLCLSIAGIGLFPYVGATRPLHQFTAHLAVVLLLVLILATLWIMPIYSLRFRRTSCAMEGICLGVIGAHYLSGFSFTLMELTLFGIPGLWLGIFYGVTRAFIKEKNPSVMMAVRALEGLGVWKTH